MKVKFIAMSNTPNHPGLKQLVRSLKHFGWDYEIIPAKYVAFGSKQVAFFSYMMNHPEYTHFFICDAHDVFVLGTPEQALAKIRDKDCILFNAEKACWPFAEWAESYPKVNSPWKYLNGGAAFVSRERYIRMFQDYPIQHTDNDQVNLALSYLRERENYRILLDTDCELFQSIAFEHENDFFITDGNLCNNIMGTDPIIIHGNGKTDMTKVYNCLKTDK